jgi:hypothetical protein
MTELVSVERMVRTVTTLSGDTQVMGCACAALLTRAGDRRRAEQKSLVGFVDGSLRRTGHGSSCRAAFNRVGRAVRESATFMRCDGCGQYMDGCSCDTGAGRRDG